MSALAAAVIRPQILTLDERIEKYNRRYKKLTQALEQRVGQNMTMSENTPGLTTHVHDSLQFNLSQKIPDETVQGVLYESVKHGLPVELFVLLPQRNHFR
jgi:hypothetical protein